MNWNRSCRSPALLNWRKRSYFPFPVQVTFKKPFRRLLRGGHVIVFLVVKVGAITLVACVWSTGDVGPAFSPVDTPKRNINAGWFCCIGTCDNFSFCVCVCVFVFVCVCVCACVRLCVCVPIPRLTRPIVLCASPAHAPLSCYLFKNLRSYTFHIIIYTAISFGIFAWRITSIPRTQRLGAISNLLNRIAVGCEVFSPPDFLSRRTREQCFIVLREVEAVTFETLFWYVSRPH